jgi:hypothetical protein
MFARQIIPATINLNVKRFGVRSFDFENVIEERFLFAGYQVIPEIYPLLS